MTLSATRGHGVEVVAALGGGAGDLLDRDGARDAAASGRVQRVLDRDVVVDDDAADLDALGLGELGRGLEVEHVAGVVLDDRAARRRRRRPPAIAGAIWSGVGEVNTAPGTAASSMPTPDEAPRAAARARCRRR